MPGNKCISCGEMITEMDFYAGFAQGNVCSSCIVENDLRISGPPSGRDRHLRARPAGQGRIESGPKLLLLRASPAEQAG